MPDPPHHSPLAGGRFTVADAELPQVDEVSPDPEGAGSRALSAPVGVFSRALVAQLVLRFEKGSAVCRHTPEPFVVYFRIAFFRSLTDFGVISMYSSSDMISIAFSISSFMVAAR